VESPLKSIKAIGITTQGNKHSESPRCTVGILQQNEEQRVKQVAKETSIVVEDALRSIASNIGQIFQDALSAGQDVSKTMVSDIKGGHSRL
jgi:hypothetical protein